MSWLLDPSPLAFVILLIGTPVICIVPAFIEALRLNKEDNVERDIERD